MVKESKKYSQQEIRMKDTDSKAEHFLVCGLGNLGQHCVKLFQELDMEVKTIDIEEDIKWYVDGILDSIKQDAIVGDCQKENVLKKANLNHCRAVLILTSNYLVNINIAKAIRRINNKIRLVIRFPKEKLDDFYQLNLGNSIAYDAAQLPAQAIATSALADESRGTFQIDEYLFRVVKIKIDLLGQKLLKKFYDNKKILILGHIQSHQLPTHFHQWEPHIITKSGDDIVYIEVNNKLVEWYDPTQKHRQEKFRFSLDWEKLGQTALRLWKSSPNKSVISIVLFIWLIFFTIGVIILHHSNPEANLVSLFYATTVMLLGGYNDVFNSLNPKEQTSALILRRLINLIYMITGIFSISIVNAWITEWLLNEKFQKILSYPQQNHIVVIGLSRMGQQVATLLQQLQQQVVGISNVPVDPNILPQIPIEVGRRYIKAFQKVNLANAKSIVIVTDNEKDNWEIAYSAHRFNPNGHLIVRVFNPSLGKKIQDELPSAKVLCDYELSAETFVASAFSESNNVLKVLRFNDQTILVTEYSIDSKHTLVGKSLIEIAYGYEVVPILYQKEKQLATVLLPKFWQRNWYKSSTESGDRLVVLATIDSLEKIDRGEQPLSPHYKLEAKTDKDKKILAKKLGVSIEDLNNSQKSSLYKQQALILQQELQSSGCVVDLINNSHQYHQ